MGGIDTDPVYNKRKKALLEFIKNKQLQGKALDLGCDTGNTTQILSQKGFEVTAVDINAQRVKELSESQSDVGFIQQDLEKTFKFEKESFDLIWAGDIIEHLMNTENFVKESYRTLKNGGYFIVSTPYHGIIKNISIVLLNFDKHFCPWDEHIRFYTKKTLEQQLRRNGFVIEKVEFLGRFPLMSKNMIFFCKKG